MEITSKPVVLQKAFVVLSKMGPQDQRLLLVYFGEELTAQLSKQTPPKVVCSFGVGSKLEVVIEPADLPPTSDGFERASTGQNSSLLVGRALQSASHHTKSFPADGTADGTTNDDELVGKVLRDRNELVEYLKQRLPELGVPPNYILKVTAEILARFR